MTTLSTALLTSFVVQTLPSSLQYNSVLTDAGATNISYGVNSVRNVSMGGASVVSEGGIKPLSSIALEDTDVITSKVVIPFIVTDEFDASEEGSAAVADLVAKASANLIKSIDIAILNGTNASTGLAVARFATSNLKDNAEQNTVTTTLDDAIYEVLEADPMTAKMLLSRSGFGKLANKRTNGFREYPDAKPNGAWFNVGTTEARLAEVVGLDGYTASTQTPNAVLALSGDFSKIGRSYGQTIVKVASEGTIGNVNLLETNQKAYIFEQHFSFYVDSPASFNVIKSA